MQFKHFRMPPNRRKFHVTALEHTWNNNHTVQLCVITLRDPIPKVVGSLIVDGKQIIMLDAKELWISVDTINDCAADDLLYYPKSKILSISPDLYLDVSRHIPMKVWIVSVKFSHYGRNMRTKR